MYKKIVDVAERAAETALVASNNLTGIIRGDSDPDKVQEQIVILHAALETLTEYRKYLTCEYCRDDLDMGDSSCLGCRARLMGDSE